MAPKVKSKHRLKFNAYSKGYTLIEVLVASGLFLLIMGVLSFSLVTCFKSFKAGEVEIPQVRSVRISLDYISKALREAGEIKNAGALGNSQGSSEIIYVDYNENVCSFKYNPSIKEVEYFEYENYGTAQQIIKQGSVKVVSLSMKNIDSANFKIEDINNKPRLITIEIGSIPTDPQGVIFKLKSKVLKK